VLFHPDFEPELAALDPAVRIELLARVKVLADHGPSLGRDLVDTLEGSKHANMKELRFNASNGVWRFAFAFDPARSAILLVGGDKSGVSSQRFYRTLIKKAEERFDSHLKSLALKGAS
jgi:hypothetical protein